MAPVMAASVSLADTATNADAKNAVGQPTTGGMTPEEYDARFLKAMRITQEPIPQSQPSSVTQSLADLDGERIEERSTLDYPRNFWSSAKNGHYRFALAGVAIVAPLAALMGAVAAAAFGWMPLLTIAAFTAVGSLMAVEGFGGVGAAAASRASGLAEKHARILDAEAQGKGMLGATDDKLMYNGRGHHFEFPPERDKGKFFNWKSGIVGGLMGAASGAVIGIGGVAAHLGIATSIASIPALAALGPVAAVAVAGAIVFGAFGLTFGIERKVLKSFFNQTDANIDGNVIYKNGPDLGRAQSQESDYDLAQHRLRRQEEINRLEKEYNERISWGALGGRFKGFGGAVPGVLIGAAVGALVVGGLALTLTGGLAALPLGLGLHAGLGMISLFSCAGGMLGMDVFAQSGTEAGAEATARAIDNEFERNRALRARGITPPAPKEPEGKWFNPKSLILCALIGAAVGVAIAPAFGLGILHLVAMATGNAAIDAGVAAFSVKTVLASSLVSGMVGATYGLGGKTIQAMAKPFTWLYDKVNFSHNDPAPKKAPLLQMQSCAPTAKPQITPEEVALLNERLNAGSGKSFTQMTQQMQVTPTVVGV